MEPNSHLPDEKAVSEQQPNSPPQSTTADEKEASSNSVEVTQPPQPEDPSDDLLCPACKKIYDTPRYLSCLHTICTKCITFVDKPAEDVPEDSFIEGQKIIVCPVCNRDTILEPGESESQLLLNFTLCHIIEQHNKQTATDPIMCENCESAEPQPAEFFCQSCCKEGIFLCCNCSTAIHAPKINRTHHILSSASGFIVREKERISLCGLHPTESLNFYCESCHELVCRDCLLNTEHRQHDCTPLSDVCQNFRKKMADLLSQSVGYQTKAEQSLSILDSSVQKADQELVEIETRVSSEVQEVEELVKARKEALVSHAQNLFKARTEEMRSSGSKLSRTLDDLKNLQGLTHRLITQGTDLEVVRLLPILESSFSSTLQTPFPDTTEKESRVFLEIEATQIRDIIQGWGHLFSGPKPPTPRRGVSAESGGAGGGTGSVSGSQTDGLARRLNDLTRKYQGLLLDRDRLKAENDDYGRVCSQLVQKIKDLEAANDRLIKDNYRVKQERDFAIKEKLNLQRKLEEKSRKISCNRCGLDYDTSFFRKCTHSSGKHEWNFHRY